VIIVPSVLWRSWLGGRKGSLGNRAVKRVCVCVYCNWWMLTKHSGNKWRNSLRSTVKLWDNKTACTDKWRYGLWVLLSVPESLRTCDLGSHTTTSWQDAQAPEVRFHHGQINHQCHPRSPLTLRNPPWVQYTFKCGILRHQSWLWLRGSSCTMEGTMQFYECIVNTIGRWLGYVKSNIRSVDPQTLHGNVHQVDHVPNGPTNSAAITTMFPLRLCGGKPSVAVTRERRYGPSRLRVNDDDDDGNLGFLTRNSPSAQPGSIRGLAKITSLAPRSEQIIV